MGVTECALLEPEEILEFIHGEMPLHILLIVHYAAREGLLVSLSLEDLLFNRSCLEVGWKFKTYIQKIY